MVFGTLTVREILSSREGGVLSFGGFSWKRALGISAAKARLSRATGIPLPRYYRAVFG